MIYRFSGYLLMLAAMTYNMYIFLAVVVGLGVGYFFLAPIRQPEASATYMEDSHARGSRHRSGRGSGPLNESGIHGYAYGSLWEVTGIAISHLETIYACSSLIQKVLNITGDDVDWSMVQWQPVYNLSLKDILYQYWWCLPIFPLYQFTNCKRGSTWNEPKPLDSWTLVKVGIIWIDLISKMYLLYLQM